LSTFQRRFAPISFIFAFIFIIHSCGQLDVNTGKGIRLDCDSFTAVDHESFDTDLSNGIKSCISTNYKNYNVVLDNLHYGSDKMPVLIYTPKSGFDYVVVLIHGGPRSMVTLGNNPIDSPFADERAVMIIPVYMGSLNRTIYPAPEFEIALTGIKSLLDRLSNFRTVILAESAGAYIASKLPDAAFRRMVLVMPAFASPKTVYDRILEMRCQGQPEGRESECRFGSMYARSAVDGRQVEIKGHDNLLNFFGEQHYHDLSPGRAFVRFCPFMILDQTDRRIAFDQYEDRLDATCYQSLTRVGGFSHEILLNPEGPKVVWEKIKRVGEGGYAPTPI